MAKRKISSIFSSRAARIALVGVALFAAPNVWLGLHADRILDGASLWEPVYLEHRVAAFERRDRVQVIVVGNSHAMASLRPHQVSEAMGLPAGSVVSFAIPGASAWEMRNLVERFSGRFPNARRVICSVDPYMVVEDLTPRAVYLSRVSWSSRLSYAERFSDLESRTRLLVGWFMPLADHNVSLRNSIKASPIGALRQFITLEPQQLRKQDFTRTAYPWGVPLAYDYESAKRLKTLYEQSTRKRIQRHRAYQFLGAHRDLPRGLSDMDGLLGTLKRRFTHVHLVDSPCGSGLDEVLKTQFAERWKAYDSGVDALASKHGLTRLPAPELLADRDFYDVDHLTPGGGRKYLSWLTAKLRDGATASRP